MSKPRAVQFALSCAILLGLWSFGTSSQAATLVGSSVTGTLYYPDLLTVYIPSGGVPATKAATVSGAVEFPAGYLIGDTLFTIDITSNQLIYQPNQDVSPYGNPAGTAFNGFVFSFVGAPTILGVGINALSNFNPVSLSFTSNSVTFDLKGLFVNPQSKLVIDLTLADQTAVPLPAALPLFAVGLGALGFMGWRKRRKAAVAG